MDYKENSEDGQHVKIVLPAITSNNLRNEVNPKENTKRPDIDEYLHRADNVSESNDSGVYTENYQHQSNDAYIQRSKSLRKTCLPKIQPYDFLLSYEQSDDFLRPACPVNHFVFLIYRCSVALYLCGIFVNSVIGTGGLTLGGGTKWFAYINNWNFVLLTIISLIKVVYTVKYIIMTSDFQKDYAKNLLCSKDIAYHLNSAGRDIPIHLKIFWVLNTTSTAAAYTITFIWYLINQPVPVIDISGFSINAAPSIIVTVELLATAIPYRLLHFYQPVVFALMYVAFSGIYYLSGGTSAGGRRQLYPQVNWKDTTSALAFGAIAVAILLGSHTVAYIMCIIRDVVSYSLLKCLYTKKSNNCMTQQTRNVRVQPTSGV